MKKIEYLLLNSQYSGQPSKYMTNKKCTVSFTYLEGWPEYRIFNNKYSIFFPGLPDTYYFLVTASITVYSLDFVARIDLKYQRKTLNPIYVRINAKNAT